MIVLQTESKSYWVNFGTLIAMVAQTLLTQSLLMNVTRVLYKLNIERWLNKYHQLRDPCHAFMSEYIHLDHMEIATHIKHKTTTTNTTSTPLRVVFDGLLRTLTGVQLSRMICLPISLDFILMFWFLVQISIN